MCMKCSHMDLKAKKWNECPKCKNKDTDFFLLVIPEDFISAERGD